MNVNGTSSMQQMQQQMQMRKMDGTGGGQGKGMKEVMQNLSEDDRATLQEQMSSLSQTDRKAAMEQMKQLDPTSEDYTQSLTDILNQYIDPTTTSSTISSTGTFSIYA